MTRVKMLRPVIENPKYIQALTKLLIQVVKREYAAQIQNSQDPKDGLQVVLKMLIRDVDASVVASLKHVALMPKLSKDVREFIAKEYSNNLKLGIRKFTSRQIRELRAKVQKMQFEGARQEDIAKAVKASFGVSARHARFLARQESNLLTAKLKQARYKEAGVDEYYWVSVKGTPEHPVRPLHQELNARSAKGETFRFSNPPRSGPKGEKQNPGEPFNCRCVAVPVVKFK